MYNLMFAVLAVNEKDDQEFLQELYLSHHMKMYRMAYAITRNMNETEDAVSDACVSMIHKVSLLRELDKDVQEGYLISTVRNAAYKIKQGASRRNKIEEKLRTSYLTEETTPEKILLQKCSIQELVEALDQLAEEDQMILRMKYFEKKSDREIAKEFGIKDVSVRSRLTRARQRVLQRLEAQDE